MNKATQQNKQWILKYDITGTQDVLNHFAHLKIKDGNQAETYIVTDTGEETYVYFQLTSGVKLIGVDGEFQQHWLVESNGELLEPTPILPQEILKNGSGGVAKRLPDREIIYSQFRTLGNTSHLCRDGVILGNKRSVSKKTKNVVVEEPPKKIRRTRTKKIVVTTSEPPTPQIVEEPPKKIKKTRAKKNEEEDVPEDIILEGIFEGELRQERKSDEAYRRYHPLGWVPEKRGVNNPFMMFVSKNRKFNIRYWQSLCFKELAWIFEGIEDSSLPIKKKWDYDNECYEPTLYGFTREEFMGRVVMWFYNDGGRCGKSRLADIIGCYYNTYYADPGISMKDMAANITARDKAKALDVIILDIPRLEGTKKEKLYQFIERLKNGKVSSGKYRGVWEHNLRGTPVVMVFSNDLPMTEKWVGNGYDKTLTDDRWSIRGILPVQWEEEKMCDCEWTKTTPCECKQEGCTRTCIHKCDCQRRTTIIEWNLLYTDYTLEGLVPKRSVKEVLIQKRKELKKRCDEGGNPEDLKHLKQVNKGLEDIEDIEGSAKLASKDIVVPYWLEDQYPYADGWETHPAHCSWTPMPPLPTYTPKSNKPKDLRDSMRCSEPGDLPREWAYLYQMYGRHHRYIDYSNWNTEYKRRTALELATPDEDSEDNRTEAIPYSSYVPEDPDSAKLKRIVDSIENARRELTQPKKEKTLITLPPPPLDDQLLDELDQISQSTQENIIVQEELRKLEDEPEDEILM